MKKEIDLHLHTLVSDGEMTPDDILTCAQELGIKKISITDHDAIGAYHHFGFDPVKKAKERGIELIPGIEIDSFYGGIELHILGYHIDTQSKALYDYLSHVQEIRKLRLKEQIVQINTVLGKEVLKEKEIIIPHRDTYMRPHVVWPLMIAGLFSEYKEAAKWVSDNSKPTVAFAKTHANEIIALIRKAGGMAYLAHPGYYILEGGLNIDSILKDLIPLGLEGMEIEYPYWKTNPKFKTKKSEYELIRFLRQKAKEYKLLTSCGSDAHTVDQFRTYQMRRR